MKIFLIIYQIFIITSFVSCAHLGKRQTNVNNLDNIQSLLQELEKANLNINEIGNNVNKNTNNAKTDTPVRDSLAKLFSAFQQFASAYVGVLTSVGKTIVNPIGVNPVGVHFLDAPIEPPIGIKQIAENLRQFQDSVQEVTKSVTNLVTRQGPVDNFVVLNEMQKFLRLWSQQIQDVSEQVTRAFGGLDSEPVTNTKTIPEQIREMWQNLLKVLEDTVNNISNQVNRIIGGQQPKSGTDINSADIRENEKPLQTDLLREFKNLLESIQKRVKTLTQQLDSLMSGTNTDKELKAEHRELP